MTSFHKIPVRDFMSSPVLAVSPDDALADVYDRLWQADISSLAVVDNDGRAIGVISRTDLLREGRRATESLSSVIETRKVLLDMPDKVAQDIMGKDVETVSSKDSIADAAAAMVRRGVHRVFVTDRGALVGVLSTLDVILAVSQQDTRETIENYMSSPVVTATVSETVGKTTDLLSSKNVSGIVVTENDWPVGVYTQVEALAVKDFPQDTLIDDAMDPAVICLPHQTSMQRAAKQAIRMRVRRVAVSNQREMVGLLSGLDFARFAAK